MSLSLLSGLLYVAGFVPYIVAIVRGETKPSKATWIVWSVLDIVALIGEIIHGQVSGTLVAGTVGATTVAVLALINGERGWTKTELFCLVAGLIGAVALIVDATSAIVISSVAMLIGTIPTWQRAWTNPQGEDRTAWLVYASACVIGVAAITEWSVADALQPFVYLVIDGTVAAIVWLKK